MNLIFKEDLPERAQAHEMVDLMVEGANALGRQAAPCLENPTPDQVAAAKLVLVGAITRWTEAGAGAITTQTAGPFSQTRDTTRRTGLRTVAERDHGLAGDLSKKLYGVHVANV